MNDHIEFMLQKHQNDGILIDANVLLLFFIGAFRPDLIGRHKRINAFTRHDFDLLLSLVRRVDRVLTTPNILTEVSNLSTGLSDDYFDSFASSLDLLTEEYVASKDAASSAGFPSLGITDAGIALLAERGPLVLTTDFPLYLWLTSAGIDALNFNHIRPLA